MRQPPAGMILIAEAADAADRGRRWPSRAARTDSWKCWRVAAARAVVAASTRCWIDGIGSPQLFFAVAIQRQPAVAIRMHVVVAADARRAARDARPPVGDQRVAEQQLAGAVAQLRRAAAGVFPDAEIVTHVRPIGPAAEELPRDQAVLLVHARVDLQRPDRSSSETRGGRSCSGRRDRIDSRARSESAARPTAGAGAGSSSSRTRARTSARDTRRCRRSHRPSRRGATATRRRLRRSSSSLRIERLVVELQLLRLQQLLEREVRRVARAGRTDLTRVAAAADARGRRSRRRCSSPAASSRTGCRSAPPTP